MHPPSARRSLGRRSIGAPQCHALGRWLLDRTSIDTRAIPAVRAHDKAAIGQLAELAVVLSLLLAVYWQAVVEMVGRWRTDEGASHGFLIVPIATAILWARRRDLAAAPRRIFPPGLCVLALGLLVEVVAGWADIAFIQPVALLISVGGLVLYMAGPALFKVAIFPYAFLYFMVPWPDFLVEMVSFPLQLLTSTYATMLAGLMGIPIKRVGVDLYMPGLSLTIAAACSGIRSQMALMALASLFAYLTQASLPRRLLLFLSGIPVALIANVVRVTLVILVGLYVDKRLAIGLFHDYSGPVLFLFSTLALMGLQRLITGCQSQASS